MIEIEESAQAVALLHLGGRAPQQWRLSQKLVVKSLMVSLAVVVLSVLPREKAQVVLPERDHTIETFLFDRPHEPFGVRVWWMPAMCTRRVCSPITKKTR